MFLNSATLECKLVPQGVIKQLPNLCKVHAGLLHGHESALSFFQLQSAALGILKSEGRELCFLKCLNRQNVEL